MPLYDFQDVTTGERVEIAFPMRDVPSIGEVVTHEGREVRRVPHSTVSMADRGFIPFASETLPTGTPGFKQTADGRCIVETKAQLDRHIAKHNDSAAGQRGRLKWTR